jgi:hypothetical protein
MVILIALPYALTAVFFFMLQKYIERAVCAGIRRFLEDSLNKRIGQDIFKRMNFGINLDRKGEKAALGVSLRCTALRRQPAARTDKLARAQCGLALMRSRLIPSGW